MRATRKSGRRGIGERLTYANVMATIAVFISLGGGAFAATQLGKNTVGTKQLKPNAVNGSKVKNKSLTAADFNGSVAGPQGPAGATGARGATGLQGATGPTGLTGGAAPASRVASSSTNGSAGVGTALSTVGGTVTIDVPAGSNYVSLVANLTALSPQNASPLDYFAGIYKDTACTALVGGPAFGQLVANDEEPFGLSAVDHVTTPGTVTYRVCGLSQGGAGTSLSLQNNGLIAQTVAFDGQGNP